MRIDNDGPAITATDYWTSRHGREGLYYLSWNAGAARLLVPAPGVADLAGALAAAEGAAISRGPWRGYEAYEVLFDDGTQSPWAVHLTAEGSSDRLIPAAESGRAIRVLVYAPGDAPDTVRLLADVPGRFRTAARLPDLRAWDR